MLGIWKQQPNTQCFGSLWCKIQERICLLRKDTLELVDTTMNAVRLLPIISKSFTTVDQIEHLLRQLTLEKATPPAKLSQYILSIVTIQKDFIGKLLMWVQNSIFRTRHQVQVVNYSNHCKICSKNMRAIAAKEARAQIMEDENYRKEFEQETKQFENANLMKKNSALVNYNQTMGYLQKVIDQMEKQSNAFVKLSLNQNQQQEEEKEEDVIGMLQSFLAAVKQKMKGCLPDLRLTLQECTDKITVEADQKDINLTEWSNKQKIYLFQQEINQLKNDKQQLILQKKTLQQNLNDKTQVVYNMQTKIKFLTQQITLLKEQHFQAVRKSKQISKRNSLELQENQIKFKKEQDQIIERKRENKLLRNSIFKNNNLINGKQFYQKNQNNQSINQEIKQRKSIRKSLMIQSTQINKYQKQTDENRISIFSNKNSHEASTQTDFSFHQQKQKHEQKLKNQKLNIEIIKRNKNTKKTNNKQNKVQKQQLKKQLKQKLQIKDKKNINQLIKINKQISNDKQLFNDNIFQTDVSKSQIKRYKSFNFESKKTAKQIPNSVLQSSSIEDGEQNKLTNKILIRQKKNKNQKRIKTETNEIQSKLKTSFYYDQETNYQQQNLTTIQNENKKIKNPRSFRLIKPIKIFSKQSQNKKKKEITYFAEEADQQICQWKQTIQQPCSAIKVFYKQNIIQKYAFEAKDSTKKIFKPIKQFKSKQFERQKVILNKIFEPCDLQIFGGINQSHKFQKSKSFQSSIKIDETIFQTVLNQIVNFSKFKRTFYQSVVSFICNPFTTIDRNQIKSDIPLSKLKFSLRSLFILHTKSCESSICEHLLKFFNKININVI